MPTLVRREDPVRELIAGPRKSASSAVARPGAGSMRTSPTRILVAILGSLNGRWRAKRRWFEVVGPQRQHVAEHIPDGRVCGHLHEAYEDRVGRGLGLASGRNPVVRGIFCNGG
jgi:hypothetical protein